MTCASSEPLPYGTKKVIKKPLAATKANDQKEEKLFLRVRKRTTVQNSEKESCTVFFLNNIEIPRNDDNSARIIRERIGSIPSIKIVYGLAHHSDKTPI